MEEKSLPENGEVKITLKIAREWCNKWKDGKGTLEKHKKIEAYLIPAESLKFVLEKGSDFVRAHIGINDKGEETLMFVATTFNKETGIYEDIISNGSSLAKSAEDDVYDGARPCPPY